MSSCLRSLRKTTQWPSGEMNGPAVVARGVGELPHVRAVGVHDVDVRVAVAVAAEGDLLAVGRKGPFGIVACVVGQPPEVLPSRSASKMSMCGSKSHW